MLNIIRKVEGWLNQLQVNPVELREQRGMKGKKHFVEWLLAYQMIMDFYRALPHEDGEVERVRGHVLRGLSIIDASEYHDMGGVDNKRFAEDILSYLYACGLAKDFGFDTKFYLSEITKILPRVYAHAPARGVSPRMALVRRLEAIGLPATDTLAQLVDGALIRQRRSVVALQKVDVYVMLHEVSHLTKSGRSPSHLLSDADREYLSELLGSLLYPDMIDDIDLLAEVVEALAWIGQGDAKGYKKALDLIALSQNKNGSFGMYEDARCDLGSQGGLYDVDVGMYLHTTVVCLGALRYRAAVMPH